METWNFPVLLSQMQESPWSEGAPPPPPPPAKRSLSFSDLQQSLRDQNNGTKKDAAFRNNILILVAFVALVALVIHLYKRHKNAAPPDNVRRLGWELGRLVHFPFGTRLLLSWVARSTKTPFASLLLSAALFDKCVKEWASQPTFSVARHWGQERLARLRPILFDVAGS